MPPALASAAAAAAAAGGAAPSLKQRLSGTSVQPRSRSMPKGAGAAAAAAEAPSTPHSRLLEAVAPLTPGSAPAAAAPAGAALQLGQGFRDMLGLRWQHSPGGTGASPRGTTFGTYLGPATGPAGSGATSSGQVVSAATTAEVHQQYLAELYGQYAASSASLRLQRQLQAGQHCQPGVATAERAIPGSNARESCAAPMGVPAAAAATCPASAFEDMMEVEMEVEAVADAGAGCGALPKLLEEQVGLCARRWVRKGGGKG